MEILPKCIGDPIVAAKPGRLVEVSFSGLAVVLRMSFEEAMTFAAQLASATRAK